MAFFERQRSHSGPVIPTEPSPEWFWISDLAVRNHWYDLKWKPFSHETRSNEYPPEKPAHDDPEYCRKMGIFIHKEFESETSLKLHQFPVVTFAAETTEEKAAVKYLLKFYHAFRNFLYSPKITEIMEIDLIGVLADTNVLICGRVDEVRYDRGSKSLIISDLKTRKKMSEGCENAEMETVVQISLYRRILGDFLNGVTPWKIMAEVMEIDIEKEFSSGFQQATLQCGVPAKNFEDLYGAIWRSLWYLPKVLELNIEYVHQGTRKTFKDKVIDVAQAEQRLERKLEHFFAGYTTNAYDAA